MIDLPPSSHPDYKRLYRLRRLSKMTPEQILKEKEYKRKKAREHYQKVGKFKQKEKYWSDPIYRENIKRYVREFYDHPKRIERGKQLRKQAYWKDPERAKRAAKRYRQANHAAYLKREALRRENNRENFRKYCREKSRNLTDCYVREQLSKNHPTKSCKEWTQKES